MYRDNERPLLGGLPDALRAAVERELAPDERVLWADRPVRRLAALAKVPIALFAIPWTGFSVFWMAGASNGGIAFALFGVPFVAIGIGMLLSPWLAMRNADRSVNVVTDRRAISFTASSRGVRTVRSFAPADLGHMRRVERDDGSGNLIFSETTVRDHDGGRRTTRTGFMGVREVKHVEDVVRQMISRETS